MSSPRSVVDALLRENDPSADVAMLKACSRRLETIAARTEAVGELCERREQLAAALRTLPESQREVVVLKVDGELTFEQIGATLSISANTAASRYRYALERLRGLLSEPERARAEGE